MILCIDTKALKTSSDIQKDVKLEDLLLKHTKYYDSEKEALKDNYSPLDFSVSIRTVHTNLVVQTNLTDECGVEQKRYYTNLTNIEPFIHKGLDLIMYLSSIGVLHNINYKLGFDALMLNSSMFQPIGLYNPTFPYCHPIIYSHIIIADDVAEEFRSYLKEDREIVHISTIKDNMQGNICALTDTLIEVKEEKHDA